MVLCYSCTVQAETTWASHRVGRLGVESWAMASGLCDVQLICASHSCHHCLLPHLRHTLNPSQPPPAWSLCSVTWRLFPFLSLSSWWAKSRSQNSEERSKPFFDCGHEGVNKQALLSPDANGWTHAFWGWIGAKGDEVLQGLGCWAPPAESPPLFPARLCQQQFREPNKAFVLFLQWLIYAKKSIVWKRKREHL